MQVKVMTFNIRYDTLDDGINCFEGRKKLIKDFLPKISRMLSDFKRFCLTSSSGFSSSFLIIWF